MCVGTRAPHCRSASLPLPSSRITTGAQRTVVVGCWLLLSVWCCLSTIDCGFFTVLILVGNVYVYVRVCSVRAWITHSNSMQENQVGMCNGNGWGAVRLQINCSHDINIIPEIRNRVLKHGTWHIHLSKIEYWYDAWFEYCSQVFALLVWQWFLEDWDSLTHESNCLNYPNLLQNRRKHLPNAIADKAESSGMCGAQRPSEMPTRIYKSSFSFTSLDNY